MWALVMSSWAQCVCPGEKLDIGRNATWLIIIETRQHFNENLGTILLIEQECLAKYKDLHDLTISVAATSVF